MLKYLSTLLLLAIPFTDAELISEGWISEHCTEVNEGVTCKNVNFSKQDLETEVIISNKSEVTIKYGDIESLGDNFFSKFPMCTKFSLDNVNVKFEQLHKNWNIDVLALEQCNITGVKDSNIFRSLPKLSLLVLIESTIDYSALDKSLFGDNSEMKIVVIEHYDFESVDENAFDGLPNLEKIHLGGLNGTVPSKFFENKPKLKSVSLPYNSLTKFPKDILPEGITELNLKMNQIHHLSSEDFKDFKSARTLEKLYLGGNGIEELDVGVFDELVNLKELGLDSNKLNTVSTKHFKSLKNLTKLVLWGNHLRNSDIKDLGNDVEVRV